MNGADDADARAFRARRVLVVEQLLMLCNVHFGFVVCTFVAACLQADGHAAGAWRSAVELGRAARRTHAEPCGCARVCACVAVTAEPKPANGCLPANGAAANWLASRTSITVAGQQQAVRSLCVRHALSLSVDSKAPA